MIVLLFQKLVHKHHHHKLHKLLRKARNHGFPKDLELNTNHFSKVMVIFTSPGLQDIKSVDKEFSRLSSTRIKPFLIRLDRENGYFSKIPQIRISDAYDNIDDIYDVICRKLIALR